MLEFVKNLLYEITVRSGVIVYLLPIIMHFDLLFCKDSSNYKQKDAKGEEMTICKVNGKLFPPFGVHNVLKIENVKIRHDDVLLCGFEKTGCHWVYEIMSMLVNGKAKQTKYGKVVGGMIEALPNILLDSYPSPRVLNTHVDYDELPKQARTKKTKIVLTVRNPKDTCVSFFNHVKNLKPYYHYDGDFEGCFPLFVEGKIEYGSYFDCYVKWDNVMKTHKDQPVLLVRFEDLKSDPARNVKRIAKFLDIQVPDEFVQEVVGATSFNVMKKKREGSIESAFYRKGKVGDWRNWMTDEHSAQIDKLAEEKMAGCSEKFKY